MKLVKIDSTSPAQAFPVSSGALRVTDPCYDLQTWCAGTLENVKNGVWMAHVGMHKDEFDLRGMEKLKAKYQGVADELSANSSSEFLARYSREEVQRWTERIEAYEGRVAYLHIVHSDAKSRFNPEVAFDSDWVDLGIDVGVDSGQAGFFDLALFTQVCSAEALKEKFYSEICTLTLDTGDVAHAIGCASSTGFGDGGYTCLVRRVEGEAVEAIILYMTECEEEDGEDDQDE